MNRSKLRHSMITLYALPLLAALGHTNTFAASPDEIIETQKEIRIQNKLNHTPTEETLSAVEAGQKTYQDRCAICHGADAKGNGIISSQIKQSPSDLTQLANRKGNGVFPFEYAYAVIDGREQVILHGTREMPIWGDQFSFALWLDVPQEFMEASVRGKIFELLLYLNSIQQFD